MQHKSLLLPHFLVLLLFTLFSCFKIKTLHYCNGLGESQLASREAKEKEDTLPES